MEPGRPVKKLLWLLQCHQEAKRLAESVHVGVARKHVFLMELSGAFFMFDAQQTCLLGANVACCHLHSGTHGWLRQSLSLS